MAHSIGALVGAAKKPKAKGNIDHLRLMEGEDGGHVVEHHYTDFATPPKRFSFGKHDGQETINHLAKHGHINIEETKKEETAEQGKGETNVKPGE